MHRILILEDYAATRHLLTGLLKAANFAVTTARDGANALRHLRKQSFDLMLLDIWMPRMNGLELLARLRNEPVRPKVVVVTSDDTPETLLQAFRSGIPVWSGRSVSSSRKHRLECGGKRSATPLWIGTARQERPTRASLAVRSQSAVAAWDRRPALCRCTPKRARIALRKCPISRFPRKNVTPADSKPGREPRVFRWGWIARSRERHKAS